mgnify:CR=1 FL=1
MGFKDFFIKPDENTNNNTQEVDNTSASANRVQIVQQQPIANQVSSTNSVQVTNEPITTIDNSIVDNIQKVMISNSTKNNEPDYLTVKQNASALIEMSLPIAQAFEGGFRTIKKSHPEFTKELLLKSIDNYISIVEKERANGKEQCAQLYKEKVGDKENSIKELEKTKTDLEQQLLSIQNEINNTNNTISTLKETIAQDSAEIKKKEQIFNNSVDYVLDSLNKDKNIINIINI